MKGKDLGFDGTVRPALRELTPAEWELVAGGDITVTAPIYDDRDDDDWDRWEWDQYWDDDYYDDGGGGGGGGGDTDPPPPADTDSHDVQVNIDRPLTAEEQKAVDDLKAFADRVTTEINKIPDNAILTLDDGRTVTGAEIKALWANADFVVNPKDTPYDNMSNRGETDFNNGNPVISVNIDVLVAYDKHPGGIEYFALHEISHLTVAASHYNNVTDGSYDPDDPTREQVANTIAWAIGYATGQTLMGNPEHGYDPDHPSFVVPPPVPDDYGDGGGGNGWGNWEYGTYIP